MEDANIICRSSRLNSIILGKPEITQKQKDLYEGLGREGLLDALFVLYHECKKDAIKKKNKSISSFVDRYRTVIKEAGNLRVNSDDFDVKTMIGTGYYGDVYLVADKHTNDVYAMKKIKKGMINSFQVKEERDIMILGRKSDWLTTLQYAFQDKEHLYLVMEFLPGGDLLSLLIRNGAFEEKLAKFYLAELTLALNALHRLGFVHRDIKPENLLLDRFGHLKLADFGSAISLNEDGCFTNISPVGTPDYIAPELLQILSTKGTAVPQKLDVSCDFWSMGVIAYEMVTEKTPFHSANLYETYNEIQNYLDEKRLVHPLEYPENTRVSKNFRNLLNGLVTKRSLRMSFDEIQEHPFFHGIKWHNLREQTPPIIPSVSGEDDTSNFEDVDKSLKRSPLLKKQTYTPIRVNEFSGEDLAFLGYTYVHEEASRMPANISLNKTKTSEAYLESRLSTKIKDLQVTIKEQMREIKDLQKDLISAEKKAAQLSSLDKIYHETKNESSEMKSQLKEKIAELAASKTEIKTLKSALKIEEEMRVKNDASMTEILSMTYQKWENAKKVSDQHYEKQINEKKTEIMNMLAKIQDRDNELSAKIDECDHLAATIEKYKEMLRNTKDQVQGDRVEQEDMRRQLVSSYDLKICELKTKFSSEKEQKMRLIEEVKDLRSQLEKTIAEKNELTTNREHDQNSIRKLKKQLEEKSVEVENLTEKSKTWINEKFDLMKKNDELKDDIKSLESQKRGIQEDLKKFQELKLFKTPFDLDELKRRSEDLEYSSAHCSLTDLDKIGLGIVEQQERLKNDLEKAKENEDIQRKRADNLEEVCNRLEEIIKKFNQTTQQTAGGLLEKQNEKLEDQLAAAREQAIIDRQSARTANLAVWKLEKELSDLKHENTTLTRRLESVNEKSQKFTNEKENFAMKIKQHEDTISLKENQINDLQKDIRNLKYELKSEKDKWNNNERDRLREKTEIIEGKSKIKNLEEKLMEEKRKYSQMEAKFNQLSREKEILEKNVTEEHQQYISCQESASEVENELDSLKKNYDLLKQACKVQENQLTEMEEMLENELKRNKKNTEKIDDLFNKLRGRDEEIIKLKKELSQEKSLKLMAETKGCQLQNESDELKEEMQGLQKEMCEIQQRLVDNTQKLYLAQENVEITKSDLGQLNRIKNNYESELVILKEENSRVLTDFYLAKEETKHLGMKLKDCQVEIEDLNQEKQHLDGLLNELKTHSRERDIKSEATLAQHKKLIDYLQARVEELAKKPKKTLADKIFGVSNSSNQVPSTPTPNKSATIKKENVPPQDDAGSKKLKDELRREKERGQRLKEELMRTKIQLRSPKKEENQLQAKSPDSEFLRKRSRSESNTNDVIEGAEQTIVATIHEDPEVKLQKPNEHQQDRDSIESNHHFSLTIETASPGPNAPAVLCVVCSRVILQGSPYWQCNDCKQTVHRKCRGGVRTLCEIIDSSSSKSAATTVSVSESQKSHNKKTNLDDVDGIAVLDNDNISTASSDFLVNNYSGDLILNSTRFGFGWAFNTAPVINAVYELNENTILFGCSNGLFSYHLDRDEIVNIKGIKSVSYFGITPNLSKAILIGDEGENLFECDLRMLTNKSEVSSYLEPKLNIQPIDLSIANRCTNTEKWHKVELHGNTENLKDAIAIAATNSRMVILKYDTKTGRFKPVRALDTAQSITAILFTQHTAIVSCDKFFEIDLNSFGAEEFLDMSDQSLRPTRNYMPLNVFRINSLEFLLCFKECGVFVDEYGLRSRPEDLQWIHEPQQFFYKNYLLYLIHEDLVQIMRINNTYSKHAADMTTDNNQSRTFVILGDHKKFTHNITTKQYCVNIIKTNKRRVGEDDGIDQVTQDLIKIDAEKAFKTNLNRSMSSIISSNSSTSLATLASGTISVTSADTIN